MLLPEPDGPMSATNSPASTVSETPRSASTVVSPRRSALSGRALRGWAARAVHRRQPPKNPAMPPTIDSNRPPARGRSTTRRLPTAAAAGPAADPAGRRDRPASAVGADPGELATGVAVGAGLGVAVGFGFGLGVAFGFVVAGFGAVFGFGLGLLATGPEPHRSAKRTVHIFLPSVPL